MIDAPLRLGVIGLSEGNGHPYSWSAIFNGYEAAAMESCGFPVIPRYLEKQRFPEDAIAAARVTHVWTADAARSAHIAAASRIAHVCDRFEDMIGAVDGVLLARDDAGRHLEFAGPLLDAGLPVYIDKPIALSLAALERLYARQRHAGQIFTCSALKYAAELRLTEADRRDIGLVRAVDAVTPKDWDRYAVHIVEPALALLGETGAVAEWRATRLAGDRSSLSVLWDGGLWGRFTALGSDPASPIALRVIGERGWRDLVFRDTFAAFRAALEDFVRGILGKDVRTDPAFAHRVVDLIEKGRAS